MSGLANHDLEQRASTVLISVPNLPSDLWKVVPLALPIGGALLVGTNELVHVDQSGKTIAVAVNEFAKLGSNFGFADPLAKAFVAHQSGHATLASTR